MSEYEVTHRKSPRETELNRRSEGWSNSGVQLTLTRHGVVVSGFYDTYVGIEGYFVPWTDFDRLRAQTFLPHKQVVL